MLTRSMCVIRPNFLQAGGLSTAEACAPLSEDHCLAEASLSSRKRSRAKLTFPSKAMEVPCRATVLHTHALFLSVYVTFTKECRRGHQKRGLHRRPMSRDLPALPSGQTLAGHVISTGGM